MPDLSKKAVCNKNCCRNETVTKRGCVRIVDVKQKLISKGNAVVCHRTTVPRHEM